MFPFFGRSNAGWQRVGLASAFPDVSPDNDDLLIAPRCKAFTIPKTGGAQAQTAPEADPDIPGDLKNQVLVFKYKGKIHAIDHQCPHSAFPLSRGNLFDIEDFGIKLSTGVACPKHGWAFDIMTGHADRGNYKLPVWEVQLREPSTSGDEASEIGDKEVWVRRKQRIG